MAKQTIEKTYELRIRRIANDIIESANPEATFSMVVDDDIKSRTEKIVVKALIHKYEREIASNEMFGFENATNKKVLEILNNRKAIIN